jgi:hypothetical protein
VELGSGAATARSLASADQAVRPVAVKAPAVSAETSASLATAATYSAAVPGTSPRKQAAATPSGQGQSRAPSRVAEPTGRVAGERAHQEVGDQGERWFAVERVEGVDMRP